MTARLDAYAEADRQLSERLLALWAEHQSWFEPSWQSVVQRNPGRGPIQAWGDPSKKFRALREHAGSHDVPRYDEPDSDPSAVAEIFPSLSHWNGCLGENDVPAEYAAQREALGAAVEDIKGRHSQAYREYLRVGRTHAGAALYRLENFAKALIPKQPDYEANDVSMHWDKYAATIPQRRISNAALSLGEYELEKGDPQEYRTQILRDLTTLESELSRRLSLLTH